MDQVEAVFAKDTMEHVVAVVCVRNALHPELDGGLNRHEKSEKQPAIGQSVAESVHEEEEDSDELSRHRPCNKLRQHNLSPAMGERAVTEEEVSEPVQVLHLNVSAGQHIGLLVVLNEAHCDVCLSNRELVRLLRDDADHITELALDSELLDGFDHILALNGCH